MAALPAHAVIQYDQALAKPSLLPKATRAYAYGPPSAGSRRDNDANSSASATAPTVVSAMETNVMGPYAASDVGRLKMPTPMMLPTISATATFNPNRDGSLAGGAGGAAGLIGEGGAVGRVGVGLRGCMVPVISDSFFSRTS